MATDNQLVHFDYEFSPYGQKTKLLLQLAGLPFTRIDQPPVLPRPDLEALGITYRRIPLLAVGRDVYADSSIIIDTILNTLGGSKSVQTSKADKAYEAWGNVTFAAVLPLVPPQALTEGFVKDRKSIFPLLEREDLKTLPPSAVAELRSRMAYLEDVLLADSPFVGGSKLSVADVHVIWPIRWALFDLKVNDRFEGVGKKDFPKVWKLIESLPEAKGKTVGSEEGLKMIQEAQLSAGRVGVAQDEPTGLKEGAQVTVESMDATPGKHPQAGKLAGTSKHEIVLALDSGVRLHFPREGYILREAGGAKL